MNVVNDETIVPEHQAVEVNTEAEQDKQTATPEPATEADKEENTPQAEKTFTQTELDAIIQKRIAKAEAIAERRALKAYAEKLETMSQPVQQPAAQQNDGKPQLNQFENVEDYVEAVADWKLSQRDQIALNQKAAQARQSIASKAEVAFTKAESIPGFDREVFDSLPVSEAVSFAILDSDMPEKIIAHLAGNPQEAVRIAALSPARQAAEIGKLEVSLSTAKPVNVSKAPEPIKPIGSKGSASKSVEDMSDAEFAKWRQSQIAQR